MDARKTRKIALLALAALLAGAPAAARAAGPRAGDDAETLPAADNAAAPRAAAGSAADNAALAPAAADQPFAAAAAADNAAGLTAAEPAEEPREPSFAEETPPVPRVADPIEPVNRGIFFLNDKLYHWVLHPVARGYTFVVPEGARVAVRNFFFNLTTPIRVVNTLLQGKFKETGTELARFGLNSTVGFGGFFDAAKAWNLQRANEDTGQTLGKWGFGNGFYLVLPLLGPSTARDTVGIVGDTFLDPISYLLAPRYAIYARAFRSENDLSLRLDEYDQLTAAAVDPYVALRNFYIQYRAELVRE